MPDLSPNERLVLPLFADGKKPSNREIMDKFHWSRGKVAGIVRNLQLKNLVGSRRTRDILLSGSKRKGPTCQYIQGEPSKPWNTDEIKCGKPATNGSYCDPHWRRCYDTKRTAQ